MLSDAVIITIITSIVGPVVVLYIAKRIKEYKPKKQSSDRIDTAFDKYEAIIKRQDDEIKRLSDEITRLRKEGDIWK